MRVKLGNDACGATVPSRFDVSFVVAPRQDTTRANAAFLHAGEDFFCHNAWIGSHSLRGAASRRSSGCHVCMFDGVCWLRPKEFV